MRSNECSSVVGVALAILAGIGLHPGQSARATIVSTNYLISEIATGDVPTSGLVVVGDAVFFGVGGPGAPPSRLPTPNATRTGSRRSSCLV